MSEAKFLPGVPATYVLDRLVKAGGNEVESGKLASPESSAALAVNTFGWFIDRPEALPPFPGLYVDFPAVAVDVEYCARFPWSGGRHPWLDAAVETAATLIGVESKRFEPYRDRKNVSLSEAYDRPVWGEAMGPYEQMRDLLRSNQQRFEFLDAAQLVKHAFGLVTDARRKDKSAVLLYLYAEPATLAGRAIDAKVFEHHRAEIAEFAAAVVGAAVRFHALSYREWLATWADQPPPTAQHAQSVLAAFEP